MSTELAKTASAIEELAVLLSDVNHDKYTHEIVMSLGGIDAILIEYIRITQQYEAEELLNDMRIQQLSDILTPESKSRGATTLIKEQMEEIVPSETLWDKIYSRANLKNNIFHLNESDNLLHGLVGDRIASELTKAVFSKLAGLFYVVVGSLWTLIFAIQPSFYGETWFNIVEYMLQMVFMSHLLLLTLSTNTYALLLIISSFDFWVKLGYVVSLGIANGVYNRRIGADRIVFWDIAAVQYTTMVIAGALIEGHATSWKVSFGVGLGLCTWFSYNAVYYTLDNTFEEHEVELWDGVSFGLLAFISSAWRVLSLFLWKQTLMAVYTRGKWCICIYLSPQIKWNADTNEGVAATSVKVPP